jgi:uncharacterized protein YheU (UPF0270 family)
MDIPYNSLSKSALRSLIEEYVSREGTEYGDIDVELQTKVEQVQLQLERGEAQITFDPDTETTDIIVEHQRLGQLMPDGGAQA